MKVRWTEPWQEQVKGSWWKAIVTVIGAFIAMFVWSIGVSTVNILRSGLSQDALLNLTPEEALAVSGVNEWTNLASEIVMLIALLLLMRAFKLKLFDFKSLQWRGVGFTILVYIGTFLLMIAYSYFMVLLDPSRVTTGNQALIEEAFAQVSPLVMFISIAVYAPLWEEIVFRGFIMKYVFPNWPIVGAIASAVIFAGLHMPAGSVWLDFGVYFIMGMGLVVVYWRTRKIEYAILFHFIQNSVGVLMMLSQ
ncbi:CPBP family intramembrane metalloprotease [Aerococcaceae bacterium NML190938]|nr:CPBP family intramembrane metalloprotease [Aerococcaceae bacterium NML190938]